MPDLLYVGLIVLFFAATFGLVGCCARLIKGGRP